MGNISPSIYASHTNPTPSLPLTPVEPDWSTKADIICRDSTQPKATVILGFYVLDGYGSHPFQINPMNVGILSKVANMLVLIKLENLLHFMV